MIRLDDATPRRVYRAAARIAWRIQRSQESFAPWDATHRDDTRVTSEEKCEARDGSCGEPTLAIAGFPNKATGGIRRNLGTIRTHRYIAPKQLAYRKACSTVGRWVGRGAGRGPVSVTPSGLFTISSVYNGRVVIVAFSKKPGGARRLFRRST